MPARKRHRRREPEHPDPLVRFGKALTDGKERDRQEQIRIQTEREEAKRQERLAAEHAARLQAANLQLTQAIAAVKAARSSGSGRDDADAAYRAAKALVVELETGERPDWAPEEGPG